MNNYVFPVNHAISYLVGMTHMNWYKVKKKKVYKSESTLPVTKKQFYFIHWMSATVRIYKKK